MITRIARRHPERILSAHVWLTAGPVDDGLPTTGAADRPGTRQERHRQMVEALQATGAERQAALIASLQVMRRTQPVPPTYRAHWIVNVVSVRAPAATLLQIAAHPDVEWIGPMLRPRLPWSTSSAPLAPPTSRAPTTGRRIPADRIGLPPGLRAIHADQVWHARGLSGAGRLIGLIDSGVDGSHPALGPTWRGHTAGASSAWLDLIGGTETPHDAVGHGTRVLGIACGLHAANGDTTGVAWGADWIAAAAIGQPTGEEFDADIIAAMEWLCDPDGDPATVDDVPDVVICAFGIEPALTGDPPYASCDARFQQAIDHLEAAGTVMVWSAGNSGPDAATITSPADLAQGTGRNLAVGAIDATHSPFPYPVPEFSGRGPSDCDGVSIKPDLVAPGLSVRTTFPGPTVGNFSGTSASVPHVGGVVALLREVDPDLDVGTIKEILLAATVDLDAPGPDHDSGHGLIDAWTAVELALAQAVSVEETDDSPLGVLLPLLLGAPHPNPAAGAITLDARMNRPGRLVLEILTVQGRHLRRVDHGWRTTGNHRLRWDGRDAIGRPVPAGIYFLRVAGRTDGVRKLIMTR